MVDPWFEEVFINAQRAAAMQEAGGPVRFERADALDPQDTTIALAPRWASYFLRLVSPPEAPNPSIALRLFERLATTPSDLIALRALCNILNSDHQNRSTLWQYARTGRIESAY